MGENKNLYDNTPGVTELVVTDFDETEPWKLKKHKCSIVAFYAPWCPHCVNMKDVWADVARTASFFDVCAFNCELNNKHLSLIREDAPGLVSGFPSIIIYEKGKPIEKYTGPRTVSEVTKACMDACMG